MKPLAKNLLLLSVTLSILSCQPAPSDTLPTKLEQTALQLNNYDSLAFAKIMVVGTFHFKEEVLESTPQASINKLVAKLATFRPTKVVVEWEPSSLVATNQNYQSFRADSFDISNQYNEVYQLGFRLAREMQHDSIYLFDNQTEFIGSLEGFSFDKFGKYAQQNDDGFYNKFEKTLIETFDHNQKILQDYELYDHIALMNSPEAQKINAQRMHMYEIRVGIQKNWIGPDWLGRWYQRNIRMAGNVLKIADKGDRILIIVGDNHKWTLDRLFENIPDFEVVSSWDLLKNE